MFRVQGPGCAASIVVVTLRRRRGRGVCVAAGPAGRADASDFMYVSAVAAVLATRPWNGGMIGWKPATTFARRVQDRLAQLTRCP